MATGAVSQGLCTFPGECICIGAARPEYVCPKRVAGLWSRFRGYAGSVDANPAVPYRLVVSRPVRLVSKESVIGRHEPVRKTIGKERRHEAAVNGPACRSGSIDYEFIDPGILELYPVAGCCDGTSPAGRAGYRAAAIIRHGRPGNAGKGPDAAATGFR